MLKGKLTWFIYKKKKNLWVYHLIQSIKTHTQNILWMALLCFSVLLIFFCLTASLFQASFHYTGILSSMSERFFSIHFVIFPLLSPLLSLPLLYSASILSLFPSDCTSLVFTLWCRYREHSNGSRTEQIPDVDDVTAFL